MTVGEGASGSLTIGNNGTGRTLEVTGDVVLLAGGTITTGTTAATHTFNIGGNITIGGTWNLAPTTTRVCNVFLNGTGSQVISGTGATGQFNTLTVSNGATTSLSRNITIVADLTVNAGTLDLRTYTANRTGAGGTLTVAAGAVLQLGTNAGGRGASNFPNNFNTNTLN
jgi:hypothetical protein